MSIRDRQISNESERVLQEELLSGKYPDLSFVQSKVAEKFAQQPAGLPRFRLHQVANREVSNPDKYNEMMKSLQEDLGVSYDELMYQTDRMMALADYYETEKNKIQISLKRLNRRIEVLNEKLDNRGRRQVIYDTFNDFKDVEFLGDAARNIPVTDAFVDLRHGYVTIDEVKKKTDKINLSNAYGQVKPVSKFVTTEPLSSVDNMLNDYINEGWRYKATFAEPAEGVVNINIELEEPVEFNVLSFTPQSPRSTFVTVKTSLDGQVWKAEIEREVLGFTEWHFDLRQIQYLQLVLRKPEPDTVVGTEYQFYFGASNLSLRNVEFLSGSRFVSNMHKIEKPYEKVTLVVDEFVPPETSINYFIGEDHNDPSQIIEWQAINPGETVEIDRFTEVDKLINESDPAYAVYYGNYYGQNYYTLTQLPQEPVNGILELKMGQAMYQVDWVNMTQPSDFTASLDTWKGITNYKTRFIPFELVTNGFTMDLDKEVCGRMTTYINMESDAVFEAPAMMLSNMNVAVYINNMQVKNLSGSYTLNFKKGLNKLEVLFYTYDLAKIGVNIDRSALEAIGCIDIYAKSDSLLQVSLYDLTNNTSKKDMGKFALDEDLNIVLNYDPGAMAMVPGYGVRYQLVYKYLTYPAPNETFIRILASLVRKDDKEHLTPILKSYKLILE